MKIYITVNALQLVTGWLSSIVPGQIFKSNLKTFHIINIKMKTNKQEGKSISLCIIRLSAIFLIDI